MRCIDSVLFILVELLLVEFGNGQLNWNIKDYGVNCTQLEFGNIYLTCLTQYDIGDAITNCKVQCSVADSVVDCVNGLRESVLSRQCIQSFSEIMVAVPQALQDLLFQYDIVQQCNLDVSNILNHCPALKRFHLRGKVYNVAALSNGAKCSASSEYDARYVCGNAIDGNTAPGDYSEWTTNGEKAGAWLDIIFSKPVHVFAVRYLQRCWVADQTERVMFQFDDGYSFQATIPFHNGRGAWSCSGIEWQVFPRSFSPNMTSRMRYNVLSVYPRTSNTAGIREIQIIGLDGNVCDTDSCGGIGPCGGVTCRNGGECFENMDTLGSYYCHCPPEHFGLHCELDLCSSDPCENGGICSILPQTRMCYGRACNMTEPSYACDCDARFTGSNCQIDRMWYIEDMYPTYGPVSGGTNISIQLQELPDGQIVNITVGNVTTELISMLDKEVVISNHPAPLSVINMSLPVLVHVRDDPEPNPTNVNFTYLEDPIVHDIYPTNTIRKGGTTLTVDGIFLNSTAKSFLSAVVKNRRKNSVDGPTLKAPCAAPNSKRMTCKVPHLDLPANEEASDYELYIGLVFDGVPTYRNISALNGSLALAGVVTISPSPEFDTDQLFVYKEGVPMTISGSQITAGCTKSDYIILVDDAVPCHVIDLTDNSIQCLPPVHEELKNGNRYPVKVKCGTNFEVQVGNLKYKSLNIILIASLAAAGLVLIVIIVAVSVTLCRKKIKQKKTSQEEAHNDVIHFPPVITEWGAKKE